MKKINTLLLFLAAFNMGIVIGFWCSPIKKGIDIKCNNRHNHN